MADPLFTGPKPPEGRQWCTTCAQVYKGFFLQLDWVKERIQGIIRMTESEVIEMRKRPGDPELPELNAGVVTAMAQVVVPATQPGASPQVAVAPVLVCWSHVPGLVMQSGGFVAPASPADVALLGQGRRK